MAQSVLATIGAEALESPEKVDLVDIAKRSVEKLAKRKALTKSCFRFFAQVLSKRKQDTIKGW
eukprot:1849547-Prorocentrum_lima.AAC.1